MALKRDGFPVVFRHLSGSGSVLLSADVFDACPTAKSCRLFPNWLVFTSEPLKQLVNVKGFAPRSPPLQAPLFRASSKVEGGRFEAPVSLFSSRFTVGVLNSGHR